MNMPMLSPWDSSEHMETDEEIALYLEACFDAAGDDPDFLAKAVRHAARAKGMARVAADIGVTREQLARALSGHDDPGFGTVLSVINALGFRLYLTPAEDEE